MLIILEKLKKIQPHHFHINFLLIIVILLIVIIIILINPALLGYKISKQFEEIGMSTSDFLKTLDSTKSQLLITETNLESCKSLNKDLLEDFSNEKDTSFKCIQEKSLLEFDYKNMIREYDFNLSILKSNFDADKKTIDIQLSQEKTKVKDLQSGYDILVINTANNLCCKARVDNKDIDSYVVSSNIVVCTSGEINKISC